MRRPIRRCQSHLARMDENFLLMSRDLAEFFNEGWSGVRWCQQCPARALNVASWRAATRCQQCNVLTSSLVCVCLFRPPLPGAGDRTRGGPRQSIHKTALEWSQNHGAQHWYVGTVGAIVRVQSRATARPSPHCSSCHVTLYRHDTTSSRGAHRGGQCWTLSVERGRVGGESRRAWLLKGNELLPLCQAPSVCHLPPTTSRIVLIASVACDGAQAAAALAKVVPPLRTCIEAAKARGGRMKDNPDLNPNLGECGDLCER